jgi:hypothetical protein
MADTTIDSGMGMFGFLILALLFLGNGGGFGWGGNGNNNAIQNDINRGFDSQNTMAQTRDILSAVTNGTAQTIAASTANAQNAINAIKDGNAGIIREFGNVETALTALAGKQQECCCNTLRAIDSVNYNGAVNTAAINATSTANAQKILDALAQSKIESLQSKVQTLELAQAMNGVVRWPQSITYGAGPSPFCGCGLNYAI